MFKASLSWMTTPTAALARPAGVGQHRLDSVGAGVAQHSLDRGRNFAVDGIASEGNTCHGDRDDDDRPD
jgi:hypothetical protein